MSQFILAQGLILATMTYFFIQLSNDVVGDGACLVRNSLFYLWHSQVKKP